jgi:hypothetical protein
LKDRELPFSLKEKKPVDEVFYPPKESAHREFPPFVKKHFTLLDLSLILQPVFNPPQTRDIRKSSTINFNTPHHENRFQKN